MRGTSPAARGRQRYVLARTRFVGFARRGPHVHARARRPGQIYSVPFRNSFRNLYGRFEQSLRALVLA